MNRRSFFRTLAAGSPDSACTLADIEAESAGMDRRAFLRLLGVSTAVTAAALVVGLEPERLLWVPEKTIVLPPAQGWPDFKTEPFRREALERGPVRVAKNLREATQEVLRYLSERHATPAGLLVETGHGHADFVGDAVRVRDIAPNLSTVLDWNSPVSVEVRPVILSHQLYADCGLSGPDAYRGIPIDAICKPAAAALSHDIAHHGLNVFGRLSPFLSSAESCVAEDHRTGVVVRGTRVYDIMTNQYLLRFDVLGGKA